MTNSAHVTTAMKNSTALITGHRLSTWYLEMRNTCMVKMLMALATCMNCRERVILVVERGCGPRRWSAIYTGQR